MRKINSKNAIFLYYNTFYDTDVAQYIHNCRDIYQKGNPGRKDEHVRSVCLRDPPRSARRTAHPLLLPGPPPFCNLEPGRDAPVT